MYDEDHEDDADETLPRRFRESAPTYVCSLPLVVLWS